MATLASADDDSVEIPRGDKVRASALILGVVEESEFAKALNVGTFTVNDIMGGMMGQVSIELQDAQSGGKEHVVIWYNGMDAMMSGGRSVEAGFGPNYFTKVKDLRVALRRAIWQVRHRHLQSTMDLEYATPGYEEFETRDACPATPKPEADDDDA